MTPGDYRSLLRSQMEMSRGMTTAALENFTERDHWLHQAGGVGNHALWIVAHLGLADNFMASHFRPDWSKKPDGWDERYWFGTTPTDRDEENISVDQALSFFHDRRENLYRVFDDVDEEEWFSPIPDGSPFSRFSCVGGIFVFNPTHEAMHFGQLTVVHRSLGHPPIYRPAENR